MAGRLRHVLRLLPALVVLALTVIVVPSSPAAATVPAPEAASAAAEACSLDEWQADLAGCVDRLSEVSSNVLRCVKVPTPDSPDSGLAGWFATRPEASLQSGYKGFFTEYGYAGYQYTTYDVDCMQTVMHPDYKFENTMANGEFMLATGIIGASGALRELAWNPGSMWGWADPLVDKATKDLYQRVFTAFGGITLAVIGIYLLWRSRQAQMNAALTTAGWAILVFVVVTALARWPVASAHAADDALVSSLDVVHNAVGVPSKAIPPEECNRPDPTWCQDIRSPAVRATDTTVQAMLYKNWLRGMLGSADSLTAQKYGFALYDARTLSWSEMEGIHDDPALREAVLARKATQWEKVAEQIKTEDPEAYAYLQGVKGMERIGAGFIALLAAAMFAMFDLTSSLLILLGFLIFRWAVIAAPIIGTIALLQPASGGFKRLVNSVVAAIFNIVIFGTGAAIYLFAVDLIMGTATLPGWLQVVLVWLCGIVGWMLLRPYRRITQLGGKNPTATIGEPTAWHRRFFQDIRDTATARTAARSAEQSEVVVERPATRTETRSGGPARGPESVPESAPRPVEPVPRSPRPIDSPTTDVPQRRASEVSEQEWQTIEAEANSSASVYRTPRSSTAVPDQSRSGSARSEARREP